MSIGQSESIRTTEKLLKKVSKGPALRFPMKTA